MANFVRFTARDISVGFNADWMATKTEKEFVDHESHHGFTKDELKKAYRLITGKKQKPEAKEETQAPAEPGEGEAVK